MARIKDENKRVAILQSSKMLFAEKGFFNTSISDIVNETGLPVGSIYTYFKNKEEIVRVIVEEGWNDLQERLEKALSTTTSAKRKLKVLIDQFLSELLTDIDLINILLSEAIDYTRIIPRIFLPLLKYFIKHEKMLNKQSYKKMKRDAMHHWSINHSMYITKTQTPAEAMKIMFNLNEYNQHPELIIQDVLILSGRNDHFIPIKMHKMQIKALTNAKSVSEKIFTKEEQAQNHCQIGNIKLALDIILNWIDEKSLLKAKVKLKPYADRVQLFHSDFRYLPDLKIDLGNITSKLARMLGGFGGGHSKACGARIPASKITEFIRDLSHQTIRK